MKDEARGECPACGMPIPIIQLVRRRGQAFACRACGAWLAVSPISMAVGSGMLLAVILIGYFGGIAMLVPAIMLVAVADWRLAHTRLVEEPRPEV